MKQRLELTWYNKDKALIPTVTGKYGYSWVDPSDLRYCETHTLIFDEYVCVGGGRTPKLKEYSYSERADLEPQSDNLLIPSESGDVLEALTRGPELAENTSVKLSSSISIRLLIPHRHFPLMRTTSSTPFGLP